MSRTLVVGSRVLWTTERRETLTGRVRSVPTSQTPAMVEVTSSAGDRFMVGLDDILEEDKKTDRSTAAIVMVVVPVAVFFLVPLSPSNRPYVIGLATLLVLGAVAVFFDLDRRATSYLERAATGQGDGNSATRRRGGTS